MGSEARGQRAVLISAVPQYLEGFEFNHFVSFGGTITVYNPMKVVIHQFW
jgi:hypothetical protein